MSRIKNVFGLSVCLLALGLPALVLASSASLRVKVPFDFVVEGHKLPAGDYSIEPDSQNGLLIIQGSGSGHVASVFTTPSGSWTGSSSPSLIFNESGGERVLSRVQFAGGPARLVPAR